MRKIAVEVLRTSKDSATFILPDNLTPDEAMMIINNLLPAVLQEPDGTTKENTTAESQQSTSNYNVGERTRS